MHDVVTAASHECGEADQRLCIEEWVDLPLQLRPEHDRQLGNFARLRSQPSVRAEQCWREPAMIKTGKEIQRAALRSAKLQLGDDMQHVDHATLRGNR